MPQGREAHRSVTTIRFQKTTEISKGSHSTTGLGVGRPQPAAASGVHAIIANVESVG
jgi:hypothetical protein